MKIFQPKALIGVCLLFISVNTIIISKMHLKEKKTIAQKDNQSIQPNLTQTNKHDIIDIPERKLSLRVKTKYIK